MNRFLFTINKANTCHIMLTHSCFIPQPEVSKLPTVSSVGRIWLLVIVSVGTMIAGHEMHISALRWTAITAMVITAIVIVMMLLKILHDGERE